MHTANPSRFDRLDALRGLALLWMALFHFSFDLGNWHLITANFYSDPIWTTQRTCILSMFLFCAGAGQAIAVHQGQSWLRFGKRWAQVAVCALLVTVGSQFMFPHSYIYFGVLHGMAVMLIAARLLASLRVWLWPLGLALVLLPAGLADPVFDTPMWHWLGLVTHKPITEDYVPVLPWLGVVCWGMACTQWALAKRPHWLGRVSASDRVDLGTSGDNAALCAQRLLAALGRWSLTFYMVHQPLLIGALAAWMTLTGRPIP
jgi:uncharacterized membrane protein